MPCPSYAEVSGMAFHKASNWVQRQQTQGQDVLAGIRDDVTISQKLFFPLSEYQHQQHTH